MFARCCVVGVFVCQFAAILLPVSRADEPLREEAREALRRSVAFFSQQVAAHGGYVYLYSSDLAKREGEGQADAHTAWVQPPGTPAVGMALLDAYIATGEPSCLAAARAAADCLIQGQLRSGCWAERMVFAPEARKKYDYRTDPKNTTKPGSNWSTYDDDKTQSALRFLMRLDQTIGHSDARLTEALRFALDAVCTSQFPNGAWPQRFNEPHDHDPQPNVPASYPETWSRTFPGGNYAVFYTLNDNAMSDTINTLLLASEIYNEPRYKQAALRGGEFLLAAQMPEPQPAWAQQYDFNMHPCWARKFEPPSITGLESQTAITTLLRLFDETGDRKFIESLPKAIAYLKSSQLPNGQLARFYELKTNKPLYFTRENYELTYDDSDAPTHYSFKIPSKLDALAKNLEQRQKMTPAEVTDRRAQQRQPAKPPGPPNADLVRRAIAALDDRGAWVEDGKLRYHGANDDTTRIISSATFIRNVVTLARYVGK